jgi:hypothetical protein
VSGGRKARRRKSGARPELLVSASSRALDLPAVGHAVARYVPIQVFRFSTVSREWKARWSRDDVFRGLGDDMDLDFSNCDIGDAGARAVAARLPAGLRALRLSFANAKIQNDGVRAVAERLPPELTSLDLDFFDNCNIGDEGLGQVAEHLPAGLTNLRLDFSTSPEEACDLIHNLSSIGSAGAKALAWRLPAQLRGLKLDFFGCKIGAEGAQAIAARMWDLTNLRSLGLRFDFSFIGGNRGAEPLRELEEDLLQRNPNLTIDLSIFVSEDEFEDEDEDEDED